MRKFTKALVVTATIATTIAVTNTVVVAQNTGPRNAAGNQLGPIISVPTSTLTQTSATAAYTAGQLIASNATAGSIVVPSFTLQGTGGAVIQRVRLQSNDTTATAWGGQSIQIDLWSAVPTFTNGDRAAWLIATGTVSHLGSLACIMSAVQGDGVFAECSPNVGSSIITTAFTTFWTLQATTGSGITGASKIWTIRPEILN